MNANDASGKRCVIYLRISVDRDNETSTATQRQLCEAYALTRGWTVVEVLEEIGRSAFKASVKRPLKERAIRMVASHEADVILVFKLDRFTRNARDFMAAWNAITDAGGEFASVTEQFDTSSAFGRIGIYVLATMAELESEMKSERTIPWHGHRTGLGLPPTGKRPFGYERTRNALTVNQAEAAVIREAVTALDDGESLRSLVRKVAASGTYGPKSATGWRRVLQSPTVAGLRAVIITAPNGKRVASGELVQGNWEPILERAEWERVNALLADPSRRTSYTQGKRINLLTGLMTCERCNIPVRTLTTHRAGPRYSCNGCKSSVFVAQADEFVAEMLLGLIDADAWKALRNRGRSFDPTVLATMQEEAEAIARMHAAGSITLAQFVVMNDGIKAKLAAASETESVELPNVDDPRTAWPSLSVDDRRLILVAAVEFVSLAPHVHGTCTGTQRLTVR